MKKIGLSLAVCAFVFGAVNFTSCKKTVTCECSIIQKMGDKVVGTSTITSESKEDCGKLSAVQEIGFGEEKMTQTTECHEK
ncbi:MAG: hypothetical protein LBN23_07970 [Paludibacter sp.]|jgi:hypothetical protein|nr:hypothetical protein [Paludibacter sp.]